MKKLNRINRCLPLIFIICWSCAASPLLGEEKTSNVYKRVPLCNKTARDYLFLLELSVNDHVPKIQRIFPVFEGSVNGSVVLGDNLLDYLKENGSCRIVSYKKRTLPVEFNSCFFDIEIRIRIPNQGEGEKLIGSLGVAAERGHYTETFWVTLEE